jgi:multisubunit Na+/H+ antiporter MnhF subunit
LEENVFITFLLFFCFLYGGYYILYQPQGPGGEGFTYALMRGQAFAMITSFYALLACMEILLRFQKGNDL